MKVRINVRSASRRKAAIIQRELDYPDGPMTVGEFIAETVRQNLEEYNERKDARDVLRLFSRLENDEAIRDRVEDMAASGKVTYGEPMDARKADVNDAVENALQCFDDGIVALFADGVRYTKKEERILLAERSEVTFVRLVFLAGRMW